MFEIEHQIIPWIQNLDQQKKAIEGIYDILSFFLSSHIFYRQLHFSSQPGVANGFWEDEAESCLVVASLVLQLVFTRFCKTSCFDRKRPVSG